MTEAHKQYVLVAKVETMILRNQTVVKESEEYISNRVNMLDPSAVLKSRQKTKFFTGPFPEQFETLTFLGPAKYHLKHSDSKGRDNAKKPNQRNIDNMGPNRRFTLKEEMYITLLRLRRGFSLTTIAHLFEAPESSIGRIFITWIQFIVWQHLYSRGKFVLKASNWSRSIQKTSNNKKNLVASFVTCTEAFQGGLKS